MKELKKAAFWKSAVFGLDCIRQEYAVYEELARDRHFDMSKFLKKTVERFWKAAATGYSMDEQYLLAIEESFFEPRDEWEKLALEIVQDLYDFFYAVVEKNAQSAIDMKDRQFALIEHFCSIEGVKANVGDLKTKAMANHNAWAEELLVVPNKEKKEYLEEAQAKELPSLLGENILSFRPKIEKEKPEKKKLPEIRLTSLDFDRDSKKWDNAWLLTADVKMLVLHENGAPQNPHAHYEQFYDEEKLVESVNYFALLCRMYADDVCVQAKNYDRVREFWYMSALSELRTEQLYYEGGYPVKLSHIVYQLKNFQYGAVFSAMVSAYAVGEDWIWRKLFPIAERQYNKYVNEGGTYLKNHRITFEDVRTLYSVLNGEDSNLIRANVTAWGKDEFSEGITAILNKDIKELRKAVLKSVRHDRKMHELNRTMTDPYAYACLRLAHEHGLDIPPIKAVEVLESRLDFKPIDKDKCKIPFQDKIEAWLADNIKDF